MFGYQMSFLNDRIFIKDKRSHVGTFIETENVYEKNILPSPYSLK